MKTGTKVIVHRRGGMRTPGVIVSVRAGPRGNWYEVKLEGGGLYKARLTLLSAA